MRLLPARSRAAGSALVLAMLAGPAAGQSLDQAIALHLDGRLDEALIAYRAIAADPSREPIEVSGAHNAACVLLNDRGEFAAALVECREAERLRRALGDRFRLALTLNNLALSLQYLGETAEAERRFLEALALDRELAEPEEEAVVLANLAALAIGAGRYGAALDRLTEAVALAHAHAAAPWTAEQLRVARLNRAVVLERLGAHDEALALLRELSAGPEPDRRHRAALAANLGVVYRNLGDPRRAARELERAAELFRAESDRGGLANALLNLGQIFELHLGAPVRAEALYSEAIAEARAGGNRTEEIVARLFRGRLRSGAGRIEAGRADLETALAAARSSGDAESEWSALYELARAARAEGDEEGALERADRALAAIERVRAGVRSHAGASGFLADKRRVFALAVELAARRALASGRREDALAALARVQRAKARELLDALGRSGAEPLDAAALARLAAEPGPKLEIYLGERRVWRFLLGGDRVEVADRGEVARVAALARRLHGALASGGPPDAAALAELGAALLGGTGPLEGDLTLAPDGLLRHLPFELLAPAAGEPPLVERARVAYAPSLSLPPSSGRPAPAELAFAGFGGVAPTEAVAGTARALLARRLALRPLPASRAEVERAAAAVGGSARLALDADATEAALVALAPAGVRVLHVATHALADERLTEGAALLLAPGDGGDGLLTAAEIAALDLPVDLAVLAACRSALGDATDGAALGSLTGAFLAAGAGGVIASLWEVGDAASAVVMEQLYHELGRGRRPADALTRVKRRLRADPRWADPAVWGAYVLVGDPGPVASPWPSRLPALLALAAGLAALVLLAGYRGGSMRSSATSEAASSAPDGSSATTRTR